MDICLNTSGLDADSDLPVPFRCHHWGDLGKLRFLLCLSQCNYLLLPFVIGRLADPFFFASSLYTQAAVPALRDPIRPQDHLIAHLAAVILCHKNTPVLRIVFATCVYYPLLYRSILSHHSIYCKSLLGLTLTIIKSWNPFTRNRFQLFSFSLPTHDQIVL